MKKAFTLVELIVVITILAILGIIGFISLNGYSMQARDAKRISDVSSLSSKINIEQIRGADLKDLIKETREEEGQILGTPNQRVNTFGKINFNNLKETANNFKDPSNKDDYKVAYAIGMGSGGLRYNFFEIGTISEKENKTKIVGNYYRLEEEDIPSLFLSGSIEYINNGKELIYEINNNSNNNEEDNNEGPQNPIYSGCDATTIKGYELIIGSHNTTQTQTKEISVPGGQPIMLTNDFTCNNGVWEEKFIEKDCDEGYTQIDNTCILIESLFGFDSSTQTITGYSNDGPKDIIIPSHINGVEVKTIGRAAFKSKQLTSVIIPNTITYIGQDSFMRNLLTDIEIPNSVRIFGSASFNVNKLPDEKAFIYARTSDGTEDRTTIVSYGGENQNPVIPSGVIIINKWAFWYSTLESVTIPDSVVNIGGANFPNTMNIIASESICEKISEAHLLDYESCGPN